MKLSEINMILVVGAGNMGRQIAMNTAKCGYHVVQTDVSDEALEQANRWADEYLQGRVSKGKMTQEEAQAIQGRISYTTALERSAADADVVIEAAVEKLDIKRDIFRRLDEACPAHTILATNSSSIASSRIASATKRGDRVLNMHFFNPALVMELVEVVMNPETSEESAQLIMELCRSLGKTPILLRKEIRSFAVNRLMNGIFKEAFYLVEQGIATVEEVDLAAEKGLRHPMGPFKLLDQIGIDVSYNVRAEYYMETGEEADKPSRLLEEKVKEGKLGRKTGEGFYRYTDK